MDDLTDMPRREQPRLFSDAHVRTQPFGHNTAASRAYQRAERIAEAIHLVTSHIPAHEPARRRARMASLNLLQHILALRSTLRSPESQELHSARAEIRKIISLVRVLSLAGHVSKQNTEILVSALDDLGVFLINSQRTPLSESVSLSSDILVPSQTPPSQRQRSRLSAGHASDIKDSAGYAPHVSDRAFRNHGRKEGIVGILNSQGQLGIKDIAANLPEYSEKMIQRELKSLVSQGKVKKQGSKRWSLYSLAQ